MNSPVLRDYQLELVESVWQEICRENAALAVLPTGGGKTVCIGELMKRAMAAKPNVRIAMVMGRIDLVTQTERALSRMIERRDIGVYCGSLGRKELSRKITVASIQSIADVMATTYSRNFAPSPLDLLIIDESHNVDQRDGAYLRLIDRAREANPRLKIVGFTATPFRATGEIFGEGMLFPRIAYRKTVKDMIAMGFLCEPKMRSSKCAFDVSGLRTRAGEYVQEDLTKLVSDRELVEQQVSDALSRMEDRQAVAWATTNIEHCNMVADCLMKLGQLATTVHSKLGKDNRSANLAAFVSGSMRHMVFVTILSEGFDHPPIDCVVLMRPTRSPVLYVQTVGRGLRISEGKKDCVVLDYGQVIRNLGPLDDPQVKGRKREAEGDAVTKECPQCLAYVFGGFLTCPECGFQFPPPPKPVEKLDRRSDNAKILSEAPEPETLTAGPAYLSMHQAKSGNQCVKISYDDGNYLNRFSRGIAEFFVTTSPWAMERLERRLGQIGAQLPSIPFSGEITCDGLFELVKTVDGKYDRILSVKRIADSAPKRTTYLDELDSKSDDDTSFNFGKNTTEGW